MEDGSQERPPTPIFAYRCTIKAVASTEEVHITKMGISTRLLRFHRIECDSQLRTLRFDCLSERLCKRRLFR